MNAPRRPGTPRRPRVHLRGRLRGRSRARAGAAVAAIVAVATLAVGCARFPDSAPSFTVQPSLTPNVATLVDPSSSIGGSRSSRPQSSSSGDPEQPSSRPRSSAPTTTDPCAPSLPPVIATCLAAPWGLAPLPDGASALVGERTTGRILRVAPGKEPELVATVTGLSTAGGGGLLGLALSPYYAEDGLIYAYVTTADGGEILRIAPGQQPKSIFTGIPTGDEHNGGPIAFGSDAMLYVATGDTGNADSAADPSSLAGKLLRLDAFGKPAAGNKGGSAVYASGFTDPTGICPLPGGPVGIVGVVDHRGSGDLLIPAQGGRNYTDPQSGDTLWVYQAGDGGGVDCAVSDGFLLATSLSAKKVTAIEMTPAGGFTGSPQDLAANEFGRLRTIVAGPGGAVWLTTSNKDGQGKPSPSDDRVIELPAGGGGGGGGGAD